MKRSEKEKDKLMLGEKEKKRRMDYLFHEQTLIHLARSREAHHH
jgi:hypothetical protein